MTVAFPMPDRQLIDEMESEVSYPGDFRTIVDGRPVRMTVERKAILGGVDRSAELARLRHPGRAAGRRAGGLPGGRDRPPAAAPRSSGSPASA